MAHPFGTLPSRFVPDHPASSGVAFVLPGRSYSPSAPLLEFARQALLQHGWTVQQVWWDASADRDHPGETAWVCDQLAAAVAAEPTPPARVVVVAKSLGTLAAPLAAAEGWPAVWYTPILDDETCVAGLRDNPARQLVVGGVPDPYWLPEVAAGLAGAGCDVHEVPDGDHVLWVPGDVVRSAEIQLDVARATEQFVGSL